MTNMKRKGKYKLSFGIVLLGIIFFPVVLIYWFYLFICLIVEKPKYKKSICFQKTHRPYSHSFYKNDMYELCNVLLEKNDGFELKRENPNIPYLEMSNKIFFFLKGYNLFFEYDGEEIKISDDGEPLETIETFCNRIFENNETEKYLLIFEDEAKDFGYEHVEFDHKHIIKGKTINDIATKIITI